MEQKLKRNFLLFDYFCCCECTILAITVIMEGLHNCSSIPTWKEEVIRIAGRLPSLHSDYFLSFMINIVDRSGLYLPFLVPKSVESRYPPNSKTISYLIIIAEPIRFNTKSKLSLSDCCLIVPIVGINDKIVVDNSFLILE